MRTIINVFLFDSDGVMLWTESKFDLASMLCVVLYISRDHPEVIYIT